MEKTRNLFSNLKETFERSGLGPTMPIEQNPKDSFENTEPQNPSNKRESISARLLSGIGQLIQTGKALYEQYQMTPEQANDEISKLHQQQAQLPLGSPELLKISDRILLLNKIASRVTILERPVDHIAPPPPQDRNAMALNKHRALNPDKPSKIFTVSDGNARTPTPVPRRSKP